MAAFTLGKSFDEYLRDEVLRSAVERKLGIVGEALNQLQRLGPATAEAIPELRRIVGFRSVLIHGYAAVDDKLVCGRGGRRCRVAVADSKLDALLGPR